ncbi:hypothetical protein [Saccharopolyspora pogona]|uniref:hypothetical protein n=1 Tax=Saccharopolyspora pogona TaxID=333966 RepID=UPI0016868934|nr:hypothetical protein [Saccharopolyspora pogona]
MPSTTLPAAFVLQRHVEVTLTCSALDDAGAIALDGNDHYQFTWTATWVDSDSRAPMTIATTDVEDLMQHQIIEAFRPADDTGVTLAWTIGDFVDGLDDFVVDILSEHIDPAFLPTLVWSTMTCSCCQCLCQRLGTTPDQLGRQPHNIPAGPRSDA